MFAALKKMTSLFPIAINFHMLFREELGPSESSLILDGMLKGPVLYRRLQLYISMIAKDMSFSEVHAL